MYDKKRCLPSIKAWEASSVLSDLTAVVRQDGKDSPKTLVPFLQDSEGVSTLLFYHPPKPPQRQQGNVDFAWSRGNRGSRRKHRSGRRESDGKQQDGAANADE